MDNIIKNQGTELEYFRSLWETRSNEPTSHSPEIWDNRAEDWISDLKPTDGIETLRGQKMNDRVSETAKYLRTRGLLGEGDSVIDIGCGPGLFVREFAKTVKHSVGLDFSERFVTFGNSEAAEKGIANAEFICRNFITMDAESEGLTKSFDLVFSSITPAVTGPGCIEKLMSLSRNWCYNASFVYATDTLAERVCHDVYNEELLSRWNGRGFYTLINLLWQLGYYPETSYYDDVKTETVKPSYGMANKLAIFCGKETQEDTEKILKYLEKIGTTERKSLYRYGAMLWNVNTRDKR